MKRWIKLFFFIVGIWGFIEIVPRMLSHVHIYHEIQESSERKGIDNSAVFYSEEPMSYKAEMALREKLGN